jgi:hypothetical protein
VTELAIVDKLVRSGEAGSIPHSHAFRFDVEHVTCVFDRRVMDECAMSRPISGTDNREKLVGVKSEYKHVVRK